jgi:DNA-binding transcriptional MocR family regulator
MAGKPKLTKPLLSRALERTGNISQVARDLGVSRRTVQRSMKRWGINLVTRVRESWTWIDANLVAAATDSKPQGQVPQVQAVPKDEAPKPEPERNILKLPVSDFTGARLSEIPRGGRRY